MVDVESISKQLRCRYIYRGLQLIIITIFILLLLFLFYNMYTIDYVITWKVAVMMGIVSLLVLLNTINVVYLFCRSCKVDISNIRESIVINKSGKYYKVEEDLYLKVYYSNMFDVLSKGDLIYILTINNFEYILPKEDILSNLFFF